jgi:protein SCO1
MKKKIFLYLCLSFLWACQRPSEEVEIPQGGDFSVTTTQGTFNSQDHRGKTLFLFFGFVQCPEVCPTILSSLKRMVESLPSEEQKNLAIVFITVDERDTMDSLRERLQGFPLAFYGVRESKEKLASILKQYGARFTVYKGQSPDDVAIDHTSSIFVINKKGVWVDSLNYNSSVEDLLKAYRAADLKSPIYAQHRRHRDIEHLGENATCDLSQNPCQFKGFEISVNPRPITPEKNYSVEVTGSSSEGEPVEVDFEGETLNMGFIRPKLQKVGSKYQGQFFIPVCEEDEMKWNATLIIKSAQKTKSITFKFKTLKMNSN